MNVFEIQWENDLFNFVLLIALFVVVGLLLSAAVKHYYKENGEEVGVTFFIASFLMLIVTLIFSAVSLNHYWSREDNERKKLELKEIQLKESEIKLQTLKIQHYIEVKEQVQPNK